MGRMQGVVELGRRLSLLPTLVPSTPFSGTLIHRDLDGWSWWLEGRGNRCGGFGVEGLALGVGLPEVSGSRDAGELADAGEAFVQVPLPLSPFLLV